MSETPPFAADKIQLRNMSRTDEKELRMKAGEEKVEPGIIFKRSDLHDLGITFTD